MNFYLLNERSHHLSFILAIVRHGFYGVDELPDRNSLCVKNTFSKWQDDNSFVFVERGGGMGGGGLRIFYFRFFSFFFFWFWYRVFSVSLSLSTCINQVHRCPYNALPRLHSLDLGSLVARRTFRWECRYPLGHQYEDVGPQSPTINLGDHMHPLTYSLIYQTLVVEPRESFRPSIRRDIKLHWPIKVCVPSCQITTLHPFISWKSRFYYRIIFIILCKSPIREDTDCDSNPPNVDVKGIRNLVAKSLKSYGI